MSLTEHARALPVVNYEQDALLISRPWHLFQLNDIVLRSDYTRLTAGRTSSQPSATNTIIGNNIFIEEGATINAAIINTNSGPVYIGKNAEVMEGCMIRGPFSLGEGSTLKMGAKIYGATTIANLASGGNIGTAAATVDVGTMFNVNQTTANQTHQATAR